MEILTSIAALITAVLFFKMLFHLLKHVVDKIKKKEMSLEKKKAKKSGIIFIVCYVVTIILGVIAGDTENAYTTVSTEADVKEEAVETRSTEMNNNIPVALEKETEEMIESIADSPAQEGEGQEEEGGYIEEYEEDYDEYVMDADIAAEQEEEEYTLEEMENKALTYTTLLTYAYNSEKYSKKVKTLIEDSRNAPEKDFCYVLEKSKLMSSKKIYEMTIDSNAEYIYYGNVKKDKPDGYGILYHEHFPVYIGEFRKGVKDGYGIEIIESDLYKAYFISYEGEFKGGLREGDGVEYREFPEGIILDSYYYALSMYQKEALKYFDLRYDLPLIDSIQIYKGEFQDGEYDGDGISYYGSGQIMYEGDFKDGEYDGKGTLYYGDGQTWYKGKFKNGVYNGKGTLYSKDGEIEYKGEFKNGDIK